MAENKEQAAKPSADNTASSASGVVKATIKAPGRKDVSRRWMLVGGIAIVFVVIAATLLSPTPPAPVVEANKAVMDLTPKGVTQKSWQTQSQADIESLRASVDQLKQQNAKLAEQAKNSPAATSPVPAPPMLGGSYANSNMGALPPPPPPLPPLSASKGDSALQGDKFPVSTPTADSQPQVFAAPEITGSSAGASSPFSDKVTTKSSYEKNKYAGYLPAGSFAPAALLHGLDAAASVAAQSNPQPVLLRIQDKAVLPGSANYDLKSCFAIASAFGDLSSERVYIRLAKISCVDKQNNFVLSAPVQGYVVDSDGKLGLRGKLVDRQGAKLGKALLAGFAQGLAGAFGASQGTTSVSSLLGATSSVSGGDALKQAGLSGAGTAANQLAQFYLQQAQAIFPVITINAGREATIVIQEGTSLAWNDESSLFVKNVTPQKAAEQ